MTSMRKSLYEIEGKLYVKKPTTITNETRWSISGPDKAVKIVSCVLQELDDYQAEIGDIVYRRVRTTASDRIRPEWVAQMADAILRDMLSPLRLPLPSPSIPDTGPFDVPLSLNGGTMDMDTTPLSSPSLSTNASSNLPIQRRLLFNGCGSPRIVLPNPPLSRGPGYPPRRGFAVIICRGGVDVSVGREAMHVFPIPGTDTQHVSGFVARYMNAMDPVRKVRSFLYNTLVLLCLF